MPRHLLLGFQYRAGVRPYTSCYHFAESCVFNKQSPLLILCQHRKKEKFFFFMLSLLPKLRDQFAEFLKYGSLKALSLLDLFTSVGLQYGEFLKNWNYFSIFMVFSWINVFIIVTIKSYPSKIVFTYFLGAVWLCVDKRCAETFELSAIMIITWF